MFLPCRQHRRISSSQLLRWAARQRTQVLRYCVGSSEATEPSQDSVLLLFAFWHCCCWDLLAALCVQKGHQEWLVALLCTTRISNSGEQMCCRNEPSARPLSPLRNAPPRNLEAQHYLSAHLRSDASDDSRRRAQRAHDHAQQSHVSTSALCMPSADALPVQQHLALMSGSKAGTTYPSGH